MLDLKPMKGLLVLDLTQGIAGPYAARLMAEHGARVIKVEQPGGDWVRKIGTGPGDVSVNYLYYNLGKENIELDLRSEAGRDAALAIAARADVVMESARPGVTARRGLGYDAVREINPRVQYVSVSGYGQTGPRGAEPMTDTIGQAYTGMMSVNLGMDGIPHKIQTTLIDAVTGLYTFQALSMALMSGTEEARHIDVSLMQSAVALMGPKVMEFAHLGENPLSPNPPAGSFKTKDGWIAVTIVREENWTNWTRVMGRPELATDPKFATFADRVEHFDEIMDILNAIFPEKTTEEWVTALTEANVLASPINSFGMWMDEPHVKETKGAPEQEVVDGHRGPVPRTPGRVPYDEPVAVSGADTERVLAEFGITANSRS